MQTFKHTLGALALAALALTGTAQAQVKATATAARRFPRKAPSSSSTDSASVTGPRIASSSASLTPPP